MEETKEPRRRNRAAWVIVVVLVVVFVIYPLSLGPVVVIGVRTGTLGTLAMIYAPVEWLPKSGKELCFWYAEWWMQVTGTEWPQPLPES